MRHLAAALLVGPAAVDVDDVLQEASLAALSKGAPRGAFLRPWLAGVVRHLSLTAWRRRSRRARHEAEAQRRTGLERGDVVDPPDLLAQRLELHHALLRAVESLSEPYRSTLVRRWLDGESPSTIAAADREPLATVKTRLRRGLEQLRARIGREWGDGCVRGLVLLAARPARLAIPPFPSSSAAIAAGTLAISEGIALGSRWKLAAAAGGVVLGGALVGWLFRERLGDPPASSDAARTPFRGSREREEERAVPTAATSLEADRRAPETRSEPPDDLEEAIDPRRLAALRGRVIDAAGAGVAGVEVTATSLPLDEVARRPLQHERDALPTRTLRAQSGSDGRFEFGDALRGHRWSLVARDGGQHFARVDDAVAGLRDDLELRLAPTSELRGIIVDALDADRPVPGARVEVTRWAPDRADLHWTTSDSFGRFVVRGIPYATTHALASAGGRHSVHQSVSLQPGRIVEITIAIGGAGRIEGRVVSSVDEAPIAGASIVLTAFSDSISGITGSDGRFAMAPRDGWTGRLPHVVHARGFATTVFDLPSSIDDAPQAAPLELRMAPERLVSGRLVSTRGVPLGGVAVTAVAADERSGGWTHAALTASDGTFVIGELARVPYRLVVVGEGLERLLLRFPEVESGQARIELGELSVGRGALLTGRLVDESGRAVRASKGVARRAVAVEKGNAEMAPLPARPLARRVRPRVEESCADGVRVACDAVGDFSCVGLPSGRWRLQFELRDGWELVEFEVDLAAEEVREGVVWTVESGAVVEGRVVDVAGAPIADATVRLFSFDRAPLSSRGSPIAELSVRTTPTGAFRCARLSGSRYRVVIEPERASVPGGSRALPTTVEPVSTGAAPLLITLPEGAVIEGTVVDSAGAPVERALVVARAHDGTEAASMVTRASGKFELLLAPDALVRIEVHRLQWATGFALDDESTRVRAALDDVAPGGEPLTIAIAEE